MFAPSNELEGRDGGVCTSLTGYPTGLGLGFAESSLLLLGLVVVGLGVVLANSGFTFVGLF